jgi:hypothetical protein
MMKREQSEPALGQRSELIVTYENHFSSLQIAPVPRNILNVFALYGDYYMYSVYAEILNVDNKKCTIRDFRTISRI